LTEIRKDDDMKVSKSTRPKRQKRSKQSAPAPVTSNPFPPNPPDSGESYIPLDPADPTFSIWKQLRDTSKDPRRQPGPINLQRYEASFGWQGIPTFFGLPVALTPDDLKAGKVEVAILGAPLDLGFGMRGCAFGPKALRSSERYLGTGFGSAPHMHPMVNPFTELTIVDYGDAPVDPLSAHRSMEPIRAFVRGVAETGAIPVVVGGDHSLMYPDVAGVTDVWGKRKVSVVHFDAHWDALKVGFGHLISHGSPVYRLISEGHVPGHNFIQVGLRGYLPGEEDFKWMREEGFRFHTMAEIEKKGWDAVMAEVLEEAYDGAEYLYVSFDIDVLDPAYAPGTGTAEPGGLTTREVFPLVRGLCAERKLVGFELVELNPQADPGYTTALNSNRIVRECLTGIAMRKKGITDPRYLSPLTVEHGRLKK
jgi:arginase